MKRAIVIVMDGCGAGYAPDAAQFGDNDQPNTLKHVWEHAGGIDAPTLVSLGLFEAAGVASSYAKIASYGRLQEVSQGKDSVTGHWEMMGIYTAKPFPTYPGGFPVAVISEFEAKIGRKTLGNKAASGTDIIKELGEEHIRTGSPIVYTSADSVFQLATHEDVVPIDQLYDFCTQAREMLIEPNNVQRVIARPFVGDSLAGFTRTGNRKDFPVPPPHNLIDAIGDVLGVGVVPELFNMRGFRKVARTKNNTEHEKALFAALESDAKFIFANFEDFDMLYGHRNDPIGFASALTAFDKTLESLLPRLGQEDLLIITADHGNDPTSASTDHSREYTPFITYQMGHPSQHFGDQKAFWHVGMAVAEHLGIAFKFPDA